MTKILEAYEEQSCWNKADAHEKLFVLLGRDRAMPIAIRAWVAERIRLGKNLAGDPQICEALDMAASLERGETHAAAVTR